MISDEDSSTKKGPITIVSKRIGNVEWDDEINEVVDDLFSDDGGNDDDDDGGGNDDGGVGVNIRMNEKIEENVVVTELIVEEIQQTSSLQEPLITTTPATTTTSKNRKEDIAKDQNVRTPPASVHLSEGKGKEKESPEKVVKAMKFKGTNLVGENLANFVTRETADLVSQLKT
ncbi:hypothetical protein L1987_32770 [Smallanthus sonchifolius]|uniref:Uncharacterized protein n=1 Tax=Smallanthus sonchifolius TaxID=185202 RepID=A0ACB9HNI0_9ASTR|nr:hypothetical protein L1987_32770 [Smallanthus sonchifolius]